MKVLASIEPSWGPTSGATGVEICELYPDGTWRYRSQDFDEHVPVDIPRDCYDAIVATQHVSALRDAVACLERIAKALEKIASGS